MLEPIRVEAVERHAPTRTLFAALVLFAVLPILPGCGARAGERTPATRPTTGDDAAPPSTHDSAGSGPASDGAASDTREDAGGPDALSPADEDRPPSLVGEVVSRPGHRVIVLLPLSGRSARLGAELAAGLLAARGAPDAPGPTFEIRDAPEPNAAMEAVRRATSESGTLGLIGVFDRPTAELVAPTAAAAGFPSVLITAADVAVAHPGRLWRAFPTSTLAIRTAAGIGLARGGLRAIILRPRTPTGEGLAGLFGAVWRAGGGQISAEVDYDPARPDWRGLSRRVLDAPGDTLFFPEAPLIAAQGLAVLASAGVWSKAGAGRFDKSRVRELHLLGLPDWYAPEVMRQSGRYFEGALVPVAFAVESVQGARLAARYSTAGRAPPSAVDALLWDAVLALDRAGVRARDEGIAVSAALARERSAEACAGLDFSAPDALQRLFVLTVREGAFTAAK